MTASLLGGGGVAIYVVAALLVLRIGFALHRRNQQHSSVASVDSTITVGGPPTAPASPTGVGETLLEVRHLSVAYGPKVAVDDASLEIRQGEIFGLLGPNGAGKTSTLSAIEGLLKPSKGEVLLDGVDTYRHQSATRARMGVQLQSTAFQPELTVMQVTRLYSGLYGVERSDEELAARLADAGLANETTRTFRQLSGGQQQRLALFVAVIHDPLLLLLDEPTAALDPQSRRHLWERLERIRGEGGCILLTTHSMEEAASVCDRVAIIDHGHVLAVDEPKALVDAHRDDPDVRAVARGDITLEDVFIGLTGREIRD
jgi:ABC-2 type transport system ATP-binding protein